jgi:hypothetical protein
MGHRRTPYTEEERARALGMLRASAVVDGSGELKPCFRDVARDLRAEGMTVTDRTLRRWWDKAGPEQREALRRTTQRAGEQAMAEGAADRFDRMWRNASKVLEMVLDPKSYEYTGTTTDEKGRTVYLGGRFADARPDAVARAVKLCAETLPAIKAHLDGEATPEDARKVRVDRLRKKARTVGLTG